MGQTALNVHIGLVAYALDIRPLVDSIMGDGVTVHCHLHSRIDAVGDSCLAMAGKYRERFDLHWHRQNRGLSTSWNDCIIAGQEAGADAILILNDDLTASYEDVLILARAAARHREAGIIVCEGYDHHWRERRNLNFVVWGVNPIAIETAGYMDQNCSPFCFEDSDYARRLSLCGVPFHNAGSTGIEHLGSQSQTVPELRAQNQITFAATAAYYRRKWGNLPSLEIYTVPFNNPIFNLKITAEERHAPYPAFNRTDIADIVKI